MSESDKCNPLKKLIVKKQRCDTKKSKRSI